MNGLEACLADTGVNVYIPIVTGVLLIIVSGAMLYRVSSKRTAVPTLIAAISLCGGILLAGTAPVSALEGVCTPISTTIPQDGSASPGARPDTSSGRVGDVQQLNVLNNDTPSDGATFDAASLRIAPVGDPLPGTVASEDGREITAPTEGEYVAREDGVIEFTPENSFVGRAIGVRYSVRDSVGKVVSSTYTPEVYTDICEVDSSLQLFNRTIRNGGGWRDSASIRRIPLFSSYTPFFAYSAEVSQGVTPVAHRDGLSFMYNQASGTWDVSSNTIGSREVLAVANQGRTMIAYDPNDLDEDLIEISLDRGGTWSDIPDHNTGVDWAYIENVAVSDDGQTIALHDSDSLGDEIRYTDDGGATWDIITTPDGDELGSQIVLSADGGVLVVSAYLGAPSYQSTVYVSSDGGATWEQSSAVDSGYSGIVVSGDGRYILTEAYGALGVSRDSGATWDSVVIPLDEAVSWTQLSMNTSGDRMFVAFMLDDGSVSIRTSDDYGATWSTLAQPEGLSYVSEITGNGNSVVIMGEAGSNGEIFLSTDRGSSWDAIPAYYEQNFLASEVDIDPSTPGRQRVIDESGLTGYIITYDPATDLIESEFVGDPDSEYLPVSDTMQYTVSRAGTCQPEAASIEYIAYSEPV